MRLIVIFVLVLTYINAFGQHINGPANIRDEAQGEKFFSVNDYVLIDLVNESLTNDWYEIRLHCYVTPNSLINRELIKANTTLFDYNGDSIGHTYKQFKVYENHNIKYWKYEELEIIEIRLAGYTYKSNIRANITRKEIIGNKLSYSDSCTNHFLTYQEENGLYVTLIDKCNLYKTSIIVDGKYKNVFIKESQKIERLSGAEGQYSLIELSLIMDYLTPNPHVSNFSVEADKIKVYGKLIESIKYGCCGGNNKHQLFNVFNFKRIMEFDEKLYKIEIPNSKFDGYIGYKPYYGRNKNRMVIGSLTFTDGDITINKVNFVTNDKVKFDNILRFVPKMEFKTNSERDRIRNNTELTLWSKNKGKNWTDMSGFSFLVHLIDDSNGTEYVQKLEIIDGYINGNNEKEFDIIID